MSPLLRPRMADLAEGLGMAEATGSADAEGKCLPDSMPIAKRHLYLDGDGASYELVKH